MITKKTKKTNLLATCAIIALLPILATAKQGVYIVEPFSCDVALADYAELQRVLEITPRTDFKYKMFLSQFETVTKAMNNNDCEVKDGNK